MLGSVGIARQGADAGKGAGFEGGAVAAAQQTGMGRESSSTLASPRAVKRLLRLMPATLSPLMPASCPRSSSRVQWVGKRARRGCMRAPSVSREAEEGLIALSG
jgi:hypothetical protein